MLDEEPAKMMEDALKSLAPIIALTMLAATSAGAQQNNAPPPQSAEEQAAMAQAFARFNALPDTAGTGPFPAIKEVARNLPKNTVYRPANLAKVQPGSLGILGWGNGGCSPDGASQRLHLAEIASHGYVVVAAGPILSGPGVSSRPQGEQGERTTAQDVMNGIEWALAENRREGSPLYGLIDPAKVAVSGFSCGGVQAISLAHDPRIKAVVLHNTGLFPAGAPMMAGMTSDKAWLKKLHTPVLYIQGGKTDIAYENGMDDFKRIEHVPAAILNQETGHGGNFMDENGGAAAKAAVNWLEWQLRGNAEAGRMFSGPNCGYCTDSHWSYERKKLD
jgi:hypothetical protein